MNETVKQIKSSLFLKKCPTGFAFCERRKKAHCGGFTLIETLVVITVIGVVSAVTMSVVNQGTSQDRARDGVRLSQLSNFAEVVESYRNFTGDYPATCTDTDCPDLVPEFLNVYPTGLVYTYTAATDSFSVATQAHSGNFYKYDSSWVTVLDCPLATSTFGDCTSTDGTSSPNISVNVTGLTITPTSAAIDVFDTATFAVEATFEDGTTQDVTDAVTWNISVPSIASVVSVGEIQGDLAGNTNIVASYEGSSAVAALTVNRLLENLMIQGGSPSIHVGENVTFAALAGYNTGAGVILDNVTDVATWTSNPLGVVSNLGLGEFEGLSQGSATIRAEFEGLNANTPITVISSATLLSIEILPHDFDFEVYEIKEFTVEAHYSDGSSSTISADDYYAESSDTSIFTIDGNDTLVGVGEGNSTLKIAFNTESASAPVEVNESEDEDEDEGKGKGKVEGVETEAMLESINLKPRLVVGFVGSSYDYVVTANFSDGSTRDITSEATWIVEDADVARLGLTGIIKAVGAGSTKIVVSYGGYSDKCDFKVLPNLFD
jgi:prepilin-type N-terminal cleavage/methylation domain-containing protein